MTLYMNSMRITNQILHGHQTILWEYFTGRPLHLTGPKNFVMRILTHDLFAVANLVVLAFLLNLYFSAFFLHYPGLVKCTTASD